MDSKDAFKETIKQGYACKGEYLNLGAAMLGEETVTGSFVKIPLKTINRHGLIAGATGTGKTKTLQVLSENLSEKGVPVLLMDLKGDLSGLAKAGPGHPKIDERHEKIGLPYEAKGFPVEILTLSEQEGTPDSGRRSLNLVRCSFRGFWGCQKYRRASWPFCFNTVMTTKWGCSI